MAARKAIGKRVRFEVLKRDAFTCQYCGKSAPDVILHIDHIKPVSKGGNNGILNLVTSCQGCNSGKSNVELSDNSAVKKQQSQLKLMAEKNEQVKMMIEWRESIINSEELLVDSVVSRVDTLMVNYTLNEHGTIKVRKAIKKHGYQLVLDCIESTYEKSNDLKSFQDNALKNLPYIGKTQSDSAKWINFTKVELKKKNGYLNERAYYAEIAKYKLTDEQAYEALEIARSSFSVNDFWSSMQEKF